MNLDTIDGKLLNLVQWQFPLTGEPYADLGAQLGVAEAEVISRLRELKAQGIVRQLSPVLDPRRLGYQTTLVAMRVAGEELSRAEKIISEHPAVSHGYEREHYFNIWFTFGATAEVDITTELDKLTRLVNHEAVLNLPATKLFKIGAYFDMSGNPPAADDIPAPASNANLHHAVALSATDRRVINELQQDLPLVFAPFAGFAVHTGLETEDFLTVCRSLRERGIMRRFGASVNHRKAGFSANAMTCWAVPPEAVDVLGHKLASLREVSHCYERKTNGKWHYNLFAMIHGTEKKACQRVAEEVSRQTGLRDYILLFSNKEFKKARVKYLV